VPLVLATENRDKAEEVRSILNSVLDLDIQTLADYPQLKLPPETGKNYRENAIEKALTIFKATGHWALGDDSGLEVDALEGAPGLFSARFAGVNAGYADNRAKLLLALKGLSEEKRGARFVCTVAVVDPEGTVTVKEGICEGMITASESGHSGFGYDPIFFIPQLGKTFAELSADEKNRLSHRGQAIQKIVPLFRGKRL